MAHIELIDNHIATQKACQKVFTGHTVSNAHTASLALEQVSEQRPDVVILELALASHSGMEFLYEFCTYEDWQSVPVIIYSHVKLHDEVLKSRAFEHLQIKGYLYKPETTLKTLKSVVEKFLPS